MLQAIKCSTIPHMVVNLLGAKVRENKPSKRTGQGTCVCGPRQACACHVQETRPVLALATPAELLSISTLCFFLATSGSDLRWFDPCRSFCSAPESLCLAALRSPVPQLAAQACLPMSLRFPEIIAAAACWWLECWLQSLTTWRSLAKLLYMPRFIQLEMGDTAIPATGAAAIK